MITSRSHDDPRNHILTVFEHATRKAGEEKILYDAIPVPGDIIEGSKHSGTVRRRKFKQGKLVAIYASTGYTGYVD